MLRLALIGHPVAHTRSPALQRGFGAATGVALDYRAIDVTDDDPQGAWRRFVADGGRGANVTLPFKEQAVAWCDALAPRASAARAVNTLLFDAEGRTRGDDTDGTGLVRDLAHNHGIVLTGTRVLVCGAGGAARGAIAALLGMRARVSVANRTASRAITLARLFDLEDGGAYAAFEGERFPLLVNATAAGLAGEVPALPPGVIAAGAVVYDLAYAEAAQPFRRWAEDAGAARALDGWGMLVEQAAESFALWTGKRPDTQSARAAGADAYPPAR